MHKAIPDPTKRGVALLQGGATFQLYSSDGEMLFKQDSYFFYLFGVSEDSWYGALNMQTGKSTLFMPRLPDSYAVWMGPLKSPEYYLGRYGVDEVLYVDEMSKWLETDVGKHQGLPIHVLSGTNTDSGMEVVSPKLPVEAAKAATLEMEKDTLFNAITESRVRKTPEEIAIIRYANQVGSKAHVELMHTCKPARTDVELMCTCKPGDMEYHLESRFLSYCYSTGGSRSPMYGPISASGPNGAILHYGHAGAPNDRQMQEGDMVLVDMGCEYYHYGSDITTTFPVNGKFTPKQRTIYNAVLRASNAVKSAMRPGVVWTAMHELANVIILEDLLAAGLLKGSVEDMMEADVGALFMPHGLGHFLGLDTHDVGGYQPGCPPRIQRPGFKSLRTARVLEPGMVITVEPGCYFNSALLLPAFKDPKQSKFLVEDAIRPFLDSFGGVRIEDNMLVTEQGAESFTNVPRTCEEVEAVMAGTEWR
ncbi:hypothetical protein CEUSTIGMA_g13495.t1 [Chlamydomonas eustigma]|uniref:Xaa-Pro dipeptidase n=1 Tax=Chlamydomonas eustigma TaxID=1157962 RepID=A0A250XT36_9CHLO|nr:hypothetical protein CEUSTIGMA_g13495.t1 [Chlamydomonas eustigma]|eukprot:GAX86082.1 hypothetical protein CEUSTIGMA_g13495.t1 [Chlamydomonas eustigma]